MREKTGTGLRHLTEDGDDGRHYRFWLLATMFVWVTPQLVVAHQIASAYPDIVQDDARHFVVWLRRFSEPGIFPNDPIADHFLAVTPWLYQAIYWPFAKLGVDPLLVRPLVLVPAIAILWSAICFSFIHRLWPSAAGAAIATMAMSYMLIEQPATLGLPRGIAYSGVLLLLLLFLNRRAALTGAAMLAVWGLYPAAAIVAAATMGLLMLRPAFPYVTTERAAWVTLICASAFMLVGASLFFIGTQKAGPTMTAEEAHDLPNFGPGGRTAYFAPTFSRFYVCNRRAGLLGACPKDSIGPIKLLIVLLAVAGGIWIVGSGQAAPLFMRFGLPPPDRQLAAVMGALAVAGLLLFTIAHAFAFKLHLPARYATLSLGLGYALVIAIVTGATILAVLRRTIFLDVAGRRTTAVVVGVSLIASFGFSVELARRVSFVRTDAPKIYAWLRTTHEDTVVAGFTRSVDSVPAFGRRSVFGSLQFMIPFKKANFELIAQRMTKLAPALYAPAPQAFAQVIRDSKIDYLLVNRDVADELKDLEKWAKNFPELEPTVVWLREGGRPFFWDHVQSCERAGSATLVLLEAACLHRDSLPKIN
jgi:hypothetical protein